jgi:alkylation response protein AidB-like acyl-CoA dehydrogenase
MAQAYTEISAARALVYNAARKKEAGEDFVRDAAMAKLYASQVAGRVSGSAIEWMGGMGFVREGIAEKMWRDSKIGAIYEERAIFSSRLLRSYCRNNTPSSSLYRCLYNRNLCRVRFYITHV